MEINWISIFTELTEQNKNIFTVGMKAYIANTDLYISPFERGRILCLAFSYIEISRKRIKVRSSVKFKIVGSV